MYNYIVYGPLTYNVHYYVQINKLFHHVTTDGRIASGFYYPNDFFNKGSFSRKPLKLAYALYGRVE